MPPTPIGMMKFLFTTLVFSIENTLPLILQIETNTVEIIRIFIHFQ